MTHIALQKGIDDCIDCPGPMGTPNTTTGLMEAEKNPDIIPVQKLGKFDIFSCVFVSAWSTLGRVEPEAKTVSIVEMRAESKNPSDDLPNQERINTKLFIDKKQGLIEHKGDKERMRKITDLLEEGRTETAEKKMGEWN